MKRFLLPLVVATMLPFGAFAQNNASGNATVSARIISALSIVKNKDLDFGKVAQGVGAVAIATTSPKAVKFTISGEPWEDIKITYTAPAKLQAGANQMPFTPDVKVDSTDVAAYSMAFALTSGSSFLHNEDGKAFVFLGGNINVAATQPRGSYTGTFAINVEYM